jgi:hypothetical protein
MSPPGGCSAERELAEGSYVGNQHYDTKDICTDHGNSGVTRSHTADPHFEGYVPHGWMHRPGEYDAQEGRIGFDAVPVYTDLEWGRCQQQCAQRSNTGCTLAVGPRSVNSAGDGRYTGKVNRPFYRNAAGLIVYEETTVEFDRRFKPDSRMSHGFSCLYGKGDHETCPPSYVHMTGKTPCPCNYCNHKKMGGYCRDGQKKVGCFGEDGSGEPQTQPLCARATIPELACPQIGRDAGTASRFMDAADPRGKDLRSTRHPGFEGEYFGAVYCSYAADAIETPQQLLEYEQMAAKGLVPYNLRFRSPLMESFCSRIIDNSSGIFCVENDLTGPPSVCSYYTAALPAGGNHEVSAGGICRNWLREVYDAGSGPVPDKAPRLYSEIVRDHCNEKPTLDECRCCRREDDPLYRDLVSVGGPTTFGSPACWYKPCRHGLEKGMLLDAEVQNVVEHNSCDVTICTNMVQLINSHYNDITAAAQSVSCEVSNSNTTNTVIGNSTNGSVEAPGASTGGEGGGGTSSSQPPSSSAPAGSTPAPGTLGALTGAVTDGIAAIGGLFGSGSGGGGGDQDGGGDSDSDGGEGGLSTAGTVVAVVAGGGLALAFIGLAISRAVAAAAPASAPAGETKSSKEEKKKQEEEGKIKLESGGLLSHLLSEESATDTAGAKKKERQQQKKKGAKKKKQT